MIISSFAFVIKKCKQQEIFKEESQSRIKSIMHITQNKDESPQNRNLSPKEETGENIN